jgi:hypothetical protein
MEMNIDGGTARLATALVPAGQHGSMLDGGRVAVTVVIPSHVRMQVAVLNVHVLDSPTGLAVDTCVGHTQVAEVM